MSNILYALAALALIPMLAGCGNYETQVSGSNTAYNYVPIIKGNAVNGELAPVTAEADPQISDADPMIKAADPLSSGSSPLMQPSEFGGSHPKKWSTNGWYWLNGSIQSGTIAISVNGTPIGRYAAHIDKEVTAYCHPGLNTVTFTHYPLKGGVCVVHISVLNGNAPKGTPPVAVYDTTTEAALGAARMANAAQTSLTPADSSDTSGLTAPSAPKPSTASSDDGPETNGAPIVETVSFYAQ